MDLCDNKHRELSQLLELNVENHRRIYPTQLTRRAWNSTSNSHNHETYNSCIDCLFRLCRRFKLISSRLDANKCHNKYSRNDSRTYESLDQSSVTRDDDGEYLELENRSRSRRRSVCDIYFEDSARYNLIKQLHDVGSRVDKYWLIVRDTLLKTNRLLTLVPLNKSGPLSICPTTKDVLNKLFLALQHPYICPVLDIEFIEFKAVYHVILVQPINHGSLKDLIYGVGRNGWNADWDLKYSSRGKALPLPQIQQMGRQILEALIFLKERGFPTVTHLHSGNVVIQNGVARLTGLENSLLGFTSRIYPIITSRLTDNNSIESICFGHMLFEMCAGYELRTFKPSETHYEDIDNYPQVADLIKFIFNQQNGYYPTIKELIVQDLFRNIELREMRYIQVDMFRPVLTPSIVSFLENIKRHTSGKRDMKTPIIPEVQSPL
ncbi:hypothetical protein PV328_007379 [Microctonus aethiopoides]|uniref:Slowpoke-binding protein n=1 Tax=Microctonus aethiopoides TaxID=144406 RepID=A0AA39C8T5_9HYME|nr:hypothetical protein PV328_007379 [Microctonus aethiopoides]